MLRGGRCPPFYWSGNPDVTKKSVKLDKLRPILWGSAGSAVLLLLYFGILSWSNSFAHAIEELGKIWMWILPLTLGFGVQAGLFSYIKITSKRKADLTSTASVAAAGGVSTTAMVACCMHHVTDVLPVLGASAASIFLIQYQEVFLAVGVVSNLLGIFIMLRVIQKNGLYVSGRGAMGSLLVNFNMDRALMVAGVTGAVFIIAIAVRTIRSGI